jgi:formate/nitrite transporter FocA (FNT family)
MKDNLKVLIRAILAGVMISIGGTIYLALDNKMLGAFLFSIGLFAICANGFNLYTGKIGYVIDNKPKYLIELLFTLIGNLIGTVGCGYLLFLSRQGDKLRSTAQAISTIKLNDNLLSIFILSIFCGIIMYLAVDLYKKLTDFGKYMGIFMGITVFILAGFEHCVANMYYFSAANMWTWKTVLYVLVMIAGNSVGSILLALGMKFGLKK